MGRYHGISSFPILSIGLIFAARVYTAAQTLLYSIVDTRLFAINSSVLVVANILLIASALRNRLREASIYVSQDFLYGLPPCWQAGSIC